MGTEIWTALSGVAVSVVTCFGTVLVARSGRATAEEEQRNNFSTFTKALNEDLARVKADLVEQKAESGRLRRRISDQDEAIDWLRGRLRDVVGFMRVREQELPPQRPITEGAKRILNGIEL